MAERSSPGQSKACHGYVDFREMLDQEKSINAVTCMAAIARGIHVYCEKPLARTVYETRRVTEAARRAKVATQMGKDGHIRSTESFVSMESVGKWI